MKPTSHGCRPGRQRLDPRDDVVLAEVRRAMRVHDLIAQHLVPWPPVVVASVGPFETLPVPSEVARRSWRASTGARATGTR